jgi:hypothetical protein
MSFLWKLLGALLAVEAACSRTVKLVSPITAATIVLASCAVPAPMPIATPAAQVRSCGDAEPARCNEAIARVVQEVPELATWPIVVAGSVDPDVWSHRGGDVPILVVFIPSDNDDWGAWIVTTQGSLILPRPLPLEPWHGGPYPPHFQAFVQAALLGR